MTEKEIVDWYRDLRQTSWIFPDNSRTVNLMEEEPDTPEPTQVFTCASCFVRDICKTLEIEMALCTDYICEEEVLGQ